MLEKRITPGLAQCGWYGDRNGTKWSNSCGWHSFVKEWRLFHVKTCSAVPLRSLIWAIKLLINNCCPPMWPSFTILMWKKNVFTVNLLVKQWNASENHLFWWFKPPKAIKLLIFTVNITTKTTHILYYTHFLSTITWHWNIKKLYASETNKHKILPTTH